jgi:ribonuclease P protein component
MSDDGRENTGSGSVCGPDPGERSSNVVDTRDVTASPRRRRRPYVSLRSGSGFATVYRDGVRTRAGGVLVIRASGEAGLPQVGFVAGRRLGNAVRRNLAKRRLREAAMLVPWDPGTAYVVIASPEVATADLRRVAAWLVTAVTTGREEKT